MTGQYLSAGYSTSNNRDGLSFAQGSGLERSATFAGQKGIASQAIAAFERARDRAPRNPIYHYHLGLAHVKSGDHARAKAAFGRALELQPDFANASDARAQLAAAGAFATR